MNNLLKRTITGIVFLVVMVFGIIWDRNIFAGLFLLILWMAMKELYAMSLGRNFMLQQKMGLVAGALLFLSSSIFNFWNIDGAWINACAMAAFAILLLIPVSCIFRSSHEDHGSIAYLYAGLLYVALPISLYPFLVMDGDVFDGWMFLSMFIIIWVSDVGAYCVGSTLGQTKGAKRLAPSISPKKSWWGFAGAVLLGTGAAVGLHCLTWLPFPLIHCIATGLIISVMSVCGDLVESMWKRYFQVKDSGNCIPGHGGMLDRFDSSLIAIPAAAIYLNLFNLI